ncbi:MAG: hypothetical protein K6F50_08760 [Kiritimatiellae bacterium]|nr:hypothetical protein [Kiritimatiellia bacterium]
MGYLIGVGSLVVVLGVVWLIVRILIKREDERVKSMTPEQYREYQNEMRKRQM